MKRMIYTLAMFVSLGFFGCQESDGISETAEPSKAVGETPARHVSAGDRQALAPGNCMAMNRLEVDVYDADPEFTNPKNYRLELFRDGRVVASHSFDQYCTMNNTFEWRRIKAGTYTYRVTTTCSSRVYEGSFDYVSGYYGLSLHIDQSWCN